MNYENINLPITFKEYKNKYYSNIIEKFNFLYKSNTCVDISENIEYIELNEKLKSLTIDNKRISSIISKLYSKRNNNILDFKNNKNQYKKNNYEIKLLNFEISLLELFYSIIDNNLCYKDTITNFLVSNETIILNKYIRYRNYLISNMLEEILNELKTNLTNNKEYREDILFNNNYINYIKNIRNN